jgi:hypothetical protein
MNVLLKLLAGVTAVIGGFFIGLLGAYFLGFTEKEIVMSSAFSGAALIGAGGLLLEARIRRKLRAPYQWLWLVALICAATGMVAIFLNVVPH